MHTRNLKGILTVFLLLLWGGSLQAQSVLERIKKRVETSGKPSDSTSAKANPAAVSNVSALSTTDVSKALKDALNMGVSDGINKLSAENGFYRNNLVKILLPEPLRKVESTLRSLGLASLADQGVLLLNRAAEDAVKEGVPIFANAITSMSFDDAKKILLGDSTAATRYLSSKTSQNLFNAFEPKVQNSIGKVGADKVWEQLITKYNAISRQKITTDLNEYVTQETVNGVFKMVAEKENDIRNKPVFRTTSILRKVFGAAD